MINLKSKKSITTILIINFAIIVIFGSVLIFLHSGDSSTISNPYVYSRYRDAYTQGHVSKDINWSQNIGGSLDDTAVTTFYNKDYNQIIIFGNSSSNNYDIDKSGSFMAILSESGRTIEFYSIHPGMRMVQVLKYEDTYIVFQDSKADYKNATTGNETITIDIIDNTGKILNTWSKTDLNLKAEDIIMSNDILSPKLYAIYSRDLGVIGSQIIVSILPISLDTTIQPPTTIINSPYGVNYLGAYILANQLLIFANEGIPSIVHTTAILLKVGGDPVFYRFNEKNGPGFEYNTISLQPVGKGFVLASIAVSGETKGTLHLLNINMDMNSSEPLKYTSNTNTKLQGVDYTKIITTITSYYLFAHNGQGGNMFYLDRQIFPTLNRISGFEKWNSIDDYYILDYTTTSYILAGKSTKGINIAHIQDNTITKTINYGGTKNGQESSPLLIYTPDNIYITSNTSSANLTDKDGDVQLNFGEKDIWTVGMNTTSLIDDIQNQGQNL